MAEEGRNYMIYKGLICSDCGCDVSDVWDPHSWDGKTMAVCENCGEVFEVGRVPTVVLQDDEPKFLDPQSSTVEDDIFQRGDGDF